MSQASNTTPQGGFLSGIPHVSELPVLSMASSGCCGTKDQTTSVGCCGEPAVQISVPASTQTTQGCCGEPALATTTAGQTGR